MTQGQPTGTAARPVAVPSYAGTNSAPWGVPTPDDSPALTYDRRHGLPRMRTHQRDAGRGAPTPDTSPMLTGLHALVHSPTTGATAIPACMRTNVTPSAVYRRPDTLAHAHRPPCPGARPHGGCHGLPVCMRTNMTPSVGCCTSVIAGRDVPTPDTLSMLTASTPCAQPPPRRAPRPTRVRAHQRGAGPWCTTPGRLAYARRPPRPGAARLLACVRTSVTPGRGVPTPDTLPMLTASTPCAQPPTTGATPYPRACAPA